MIKTLIYVTALTLAVTASVPSVYGNPIKDASKVPRIVGSVQFPQTRWRIVRHTIRLQIPQNSSTISQLSIKVPDGLTVSNRISVSDQFGKKIGTSIAVNDRKIIMSFSEPIAPETELKIAMKDIKIVGVSNAWLYPISVKLVGINAYLPIGIARFKLYR